MGIRFFGYICGAFLCLLPVVFMFCRSANISEINRVFSDRASLAEGVLLGQKEDRADYSFMDSLLEGRHIVVLGGQQQTDGSTQELYADLVLYLFGKGYTSLYLEVPFYKAVRFWEELESGRAGGFSGAFHPFWSNSKQTKRLRDSVVRWSKGGSPLHIKGLDIQMPTVFSQYAVYEDLMSHMKTVPGFSKGEFKRVRHSLTNRFGPVLYFNRKGPQMDRNRKLCLKELRQMKELIAEKTERTEKDSVHMQYLDNIYHFYYAKMYLGGMDYERHRDSMMFENLKWQMGRDAGKSIIWTSNRRAANDSKNGTGLGIHIKEKYGDGALTILATSFSGQTTNISTGKPQKTNPATVLTVENFLKDRTGDVSFFVVPEKLKGESAEMRFYEHSNTENDWFNTFDAFFFIKNMQAIER